MPTFTELSIKKTEDLIFGICPQPLILANGMQIGGGTVFPEINFTLPDMVIDGDTMPEVRRQYQQMITETSRRAAELHVPGLVVEFELLPDLTLHPAWGAEITRLLREALDEAQVKFGLKSTLRVTPNDVREFARPPYLRQGQFVESMFRSFELCAQAGADLLAIESTGGKEIHDNAILNCDLPASVFALSILASRDMAYLWERIVAICKTENCIPSADSACGFANTAMVLAEGRFIPRVWAAVIRVLAVARSLVAFEQGARGPSKDCAYEGPYLKAITGCPISMEGAEAACAHLSPVGNIARAMADLWSNESVNNVKLLGSMAPVVSLEQLVYAVRTMNAAAKHGIQSRLDLQRWWVESDERFDPQAYVLRPDVVLRLAGEIISENSPYLRTRRAALSVIELLKEAATKGNLNLAQVELRWLDKLSRQADVLPEDEGQFIAAMLPVIDQNLLRLNEYALK